MDHVDDLYDDLKDEYQHLKEVSSHPIMCENHSDDDDELLLLEELKRLTVNDEVEKLEALSDAQQASLPDIGTKTGPSSHDAKKIEPPVVESKQILETNDKRIVTQ
jgi:hypothetical protein